MSVQQAADILQVSRTHVVKVLEAGEIPYHMVGSHRRIRLSDLLEEMERNLIKVGKATPRLRSVMEAAFPDAMVLWAEYQELINA